MDTKEIWLIIIAIAGWGWGIFQYFLKRKHQQKDKVIDRRYEAYKSYLRKSDELMENLRMDPGAVYGFSEELVVAFQSGNDEIVNKALVRFNTDVVDFVKKATQPLLIIKGELNELKLICSEELMNLINSYTSMIEDFNNQAQIAIGHIQSSKPESLNDKLQPFINNPDWNRFKTINDEIIALMRKEIAT
jgi:hypothetical protein